MSCFWTGISESLARNQLVQIRMSPQDLVTLLKTRNEATPNVLCQGERLSVQQMDENVRHVAEYDSATIGNGYLCSGWDPFLFLVCHVFKVNIDHNYNGTLFRFNQACTCRPYLTLKFRSTTSHFECA